MNQSGIEVERDQLLALVQTEIDCDIVCASDIKEVGEQR